MLSNSPAWNHISAELRRRAQFTARVNVLDLLDSVKRAIRRIAKQPARRPNS